MKTASENLKNDQVKIYQRHWKQVLLYRVEWNSGTNKYEWESEPVDLERYNYKISSPVKWKLDTEGLNVWKVSNVTIEVYNYRNEWAVDNPYGIFGDKFSRGSKVVIKAGNYLEDESKELLYVFTGVIDKDLSFDPEKKRCKIPLTSLDFLLFRANAENIGDPRFNYRNGDGSTKIFDTNPYDGIGRITSVTVNDVEQEPGKDYTVSQLNDPNLYGKITFDQAPPVGTNNIGISSFQWKQEQTIDWLVEELVKEAGIDDYQIDPAIFDNFIAGEWEQTTTADFNAGTPYLVNTANDRVILATDNKSRFGDTTTEFFEGVTNPDNIKDGDEDTFARIVSVFGITESWVAVVFANLQGITKVEIVHKAELGVLTSALEFYYNGSWHFHQSFESTTTKITTEVFVPKSDIKKIRIRLLGGVLYLYELRGIGYYNSGDLLSQTKDLSVDLVSYGKLEYTRTVPPETSLVIKTQSSPNGSSWEAETELGDNQQVLSTPQRYFRWRAYFDNNATFKSPTLFDVTLNYYLSDLKIELANFTGMDCQTAIRQLAEFVDYEIGFSAEGKFFFRSKETVTSPVLTLSDTENKLVKIYNLKRGWDRVFNWIEAQYGSYTKFENPIDRGEDRPHSIDKYGFRRLVLSGGQLLIDNEVDIATGIARRYYGKFDQSGDLIKYFYPTPNYMCSAQIKFLPQLDLSDVVTIEYLGETDGTDKVFKFDSWTFNNFKFAPEPVLKETDFKILGLAIDLEQFFVTLELREVD